MALVLADRVQQTGTANTTVSFTLSGSVTGFQSFAAIGNGNTTYYSATDASGNWEVGIGTYSTTGPTLTRTTIIASSNAGAAVTFSGQVNVFVTYPAENAVIVSNSPTLNYVLTAQGVGTPPVWAPASGGGASPATPTVAGTVFGITESSGAFRVAIGYQSLLNSNSTTLSVAALGYQAGYTQTTADYCTYIGAQAGYSNDASYLTTVGYQSSFSNTTGTNNTVMGAYAHYANLGGNNCVVIGYSAGRLATGAANTLIGSGAGYSGTNDLTTGANNIIVGYNSSASSATVNNEATWGNSSMTSNRFWGDFKMAGANAGTPGQLLSSQGPGLPPQWVTSGGGGSGTTTFALTVNNSGSGTASPFSFNGSVAQTLSYNSIGASPAAGSSAITTIGNVTSGSLNNVPIGATTPSTGAFSTLSESFGPSAAQVDVSKMALALAMIA